MREGYKEKESTLNRKVANWLDSLDGCRAVKRTPSMTNAGHPDVSGCYRGIRIEIEGKVGKNKPTKNQLRQLRKWADAGAVTGVYWSLEEAQKIVRDGLKYYESNLHCWYK